MRGRRGEDGRWHAVEQHLRFLRALEAGEELTLELRHAEREHFAILELSNEQRERAERGGKDRPEQAAEREHRDRDGEVEELRREVERLKAELRELRKDR